MTQLDLYGRPGGPVLYLAHPEAAGHHGDRILRVALDDTTPAYWQVVETRGLGPGRLRAVGRRFAAHVVVESGDTLVAESEAVRRRWGERLRASGWRVVVDGARDDPRFRR
jgi:hypothetical protein